jgi:hypothetical protein
VQKSSHTWIQVPSLETSGITEGVQSRLMNSFASMGDIVASATSNVMMTQYMFTRRGIFDVVYNEWKIR